MAKCNTEESTDGNIAQTYGENCSNDCRLRHCFNSMSLCHHITGKCDQGCAAGYQGDDCTQDCIESINYGVNCNKFCKDRKCLESSSSCDIRNGKCEGGCKPGWKGDDCRQSKLNIVLS
ncbi:multiple epidermal growth factor-like domains protein 10 [Patella vulgata]|uniref:multiple epidermal growth factor-like domains protein 10 n=1 Tax=Patella vulgata TaxID=6465 RepID=UPI0024A7AC9C|nr:multiple epidermal growth factor-like domains protein 10 [Patella vulgata]